MWEKQGFRGRRLYGTRVLFGPERTTLPSAGRWGARGLQLRLVCCGVAGVLLASVGSRVPCAPPRQDVWGLGTPAPFPCCPRPFRRQALPSWLPSCDGALLGCARAYAQVAPEPWTDKEEASLSLGAPVGLQIPGLPRDVCVCVCVFFW